MTNVWAGYFLIKFVQNMMKYSQYPNSHSINCTPVAVPPVLDLLNCLIYSPQTSQIKFLEEASTGQSVGAIPEGPYTLHRDEVTSPPPLLHCIVLYYTLLYIGV